MLAGPPRGAPKVGPQEIQLEKCTLFINLLRG